MPDTHIFAIGGDHGAATSMSDGTSYIFEVSGSRYYAASDRIPVSRLTTAIATSQALIVDGHQYDPPVLQDEMLLVSVIEVGQGTNCTTREQLGALLHQAEERDDVFRPDFLQGLILTRRGPVGDGFADGARELLDSMKGHRWVQIASRPSACLKPGIYVLVGSSLRPAYRVYDDHQKAFSTSLKPRLRCRPSHPFEQLHVAGADYATLSVAVPSRLQSPGQLRIAVKDVFRVHGLKTSLCNSSYYRLSSPAQESADVVQKLVDRGHHILGLTKLSSMIAREEPLDAVDFQTAFSPRGDGYQSPAGSSSGSAVAVASYRWLDCALGTDTSGSGRRPALVNGIFQFRPSHDSVPLGGMVPTFLQFDTPCIFARNLEVVGQVLSTWLPGIDQFLLYAPDDSSPVEIIYPLDYLPTSVCGQMSIIDSFVDDLATQLDVPITKLSIRKSWEDSPPDEASSDIEEYLKDVVVHTYYYSFYHASDEFRARYLERFGHKPYAIPFVENCWSSGAAVSPEQFAEGLRRLEVYRTWLLNTIFRNRRNLVVLPISSVEPHYRDEPTVSPPYQTATDELFLPPILRSPDVVVPIGEIPYNSRITGLQEYLPVAVNVLGAPGMDYWILDSVKRVLQRSGRPVEVRAGSRMFS
ncbi:hypothetical protein VSDG_01000 [Cytospora chrysosperma]|uniref:Amidase domain-containing protein n=1 Tax=Cytospora chrysosperma TaxID=252740 RepID=A0A423WKK7_CYTCH|nr:hypothetical protein VSDG_01000 [Valsa sordida]